MESFATLASAERALVINEAAGRLGLVPLIMEKDFWVCWTLARIFETSAVAPHLVFKGGTSLSNVFGAIQRVSEDIDLAVSPQALGFTAAELDEAGSASQRRKRVQALEAECERCVSERFQPALEAAITARLGAPKKASSWLHYELDALAGTPNLLFTYPSALGQAGGYVAKQVKLEFGALTDQQPTGTHEVSALLAALPGVKLESAYDDLHTDVIALAITRTFWEKATILHAEYHRAAELPIRDRFARHYADFEALWRHPSRARARLRKDVADVHRGAHYIRRAAAVTGSRRAAPQRGDHAAARASNFNMMKTDTAIRHLMRPAAKLSSELDNLGVSVGAHQ